MRDRIYLDHNASSPLRPEAREAMVAALAQDGNASSVHGEGRAQRRLVEDAREHVARLVGARPADVVFTSGATEANNIVLASGWDVIYRTGSEHESVLAPAAASGAEIVEVPLETSGSADLGAFAASVLKCDVADRKALLTLQMANNETGVCQDVSRAAQFARAHDVAVHTDAVQACGRMLVDFDVIGADLMSVSSHKLGGPMGVGALIVRDGFKLRSLLQGGGQERRRRAGTENVAAIAGFGAAAASARAGVVDEQRRLKRLRDQVETELVAVVPGAVVVGAGADRLANTLCLSLPSYVAETTVIKLDLAGVAMSAGSACSSGKVGASHVLTAMGLAPEIARSAVRISLGWNTSESSLEEFLSRFRDLFAREIKAVA